MIKTIFCRKFLGIYLISKCVDSYENIIMQFFIMSLQGFGNLKSL